MQLKPPVFISSHSLPAVKVGDATISIEYDPTWSQLNARSRYRFHIDRPDWDEDYTDNVLFSGAGVAESNNRSLQTGLCSLLGLLAECGDAFLHGIKGQLSDSNNNQFPSHVGNWASENQDELSMLAVELEETPDLIVE